MLTSFSPQVFPFFNPKIVIRNDNFALRVTIPDDFRQEYQD